MLLEGPLFLASPVFLLQLSRSWSFQLSSITALALLHLPALTHVPDALGVSIAHSVGFLPPLPPGFIPSPLSSAQFLALLQVHGLTSDFSLPLAGIRLSQMQVARLVLDTSTPPQTKPSLPSAPVTLAVLPLFTNVRKLEKML